MTIKKLDEIFNPKSIAIIGASNNSTKVGYGVLKNIKDGGFKGKIFPVNKKRKKIQGLKTYRSIDQIKDDIDIAIIATPAKTVVHIVRECCEKKVKGIIILSSGFKESGKEGEEYSNKILEIAKKNKIRIMGPNCMGFIKPSINLNASFAKMHPKKGNIAFISQSGALGSSTLDWAIKQDLGFSFFASIGSMIDISFSDLIDFLGNDPQTTSIVIYMESLKDARKFMSASRSFSRNKPIIVLKAGKSKEGARAALSHTGNLAGNDVVFDSAFKRAGIVRVSEVDDLFDCAKTLSKQKKPLGKRLAIVTNAGGPGVISTDQLIRRGGEIAKLSKNTIKKLNKILPSAWSKRNPVDILGDANANDYRKSIELCLEDENVDGVLVLLTPQIMTDPESIAKSIVSIKSSKPILASFMGGMSVDKAKKILESNNIPNFPYPERGVKAFMYLYNYSKNIESLYQTPGSIPHAFNPRTKENKDLIRNILKRKRYNLTDEESKEFLSNYDIPFVKQFTVKDFKEAKAASEKIGYPVALKISSPDILHKTDLNAVVLDINSERELKDGYEKIITEVKNKLPKAKINGVTVSKMEKRKYELIIGCKKDEIFGPTIVFGMGGIAVDIFKDIRIGLPPLNMHLSKMLIKETKIYQLLKGYRNVPGIDIGSLQFILYKFAYLIADFPEIKEIDINPFVVDEKGGLVVDAKVILDNKYNLSEGEKRPYSHLVISPYPKEYVKEIKTKEGNKVLLRPIKPEDEPLEKEMFKHFSKSTQRFRFFGLIKNVNHNLLVKYTHNDYDREIGIMAELEEKKKKVMAGVVRLITDPYDNSAEFAIVVADPWQKKGLGKQMTDYMLEIAKERGIEKVFAYCLKDNAVMKEMFRKRGFNIINEGKVCRVEKFL